VSGLARTRLPFTQKILTRWAGPRKFAEGRALFDRGMVLQVDYEEPFVTGEIARGGRTLITRFRLLDDGSVESRCPCYDGSERGIVCMHVIALGLALLRKFNDPEREMKRMEEQRRALRLEGMDESRFLSRVCAPQAGARPATVRILLREGWEHGARNGRVPVRGLLYDGQRGIPLDEVPQGPVWLLSKKDEAILFVLEEICEGPAQGELELAPHDMINLLQLHDGKPLWRESGEKPASVHAVPVESTLGVDLIPETGELTLDLETALPGLAPGESPVYITTPTRGWVYGGGHFRPLSHVLPAPLQVIQHQPVTIPRPAVPRFIEDELPALEKFIQVRTELSADLLTMDPATPQFHLQVRGSPASLAAVLQAVYGDHTMVAHAPSPEGRFALPDEDDVLRYTVRHLPSEQAALRELAGTGFRGERGDNLTPVVGCREVLNFLGRDWPALRRRGWKVSFEGRIAAHLEELDRVAPVVRIEHGGDAGWFDVTRRFEDMDGATLSIADVQRALRKGEYFMESNGRTLLLDAAAIEDMDEIFSDCAGRDGARPGGFRLPDVHSAYVKSSLDTLDGIDVEAPRDWLLRAEQRNSGTAEETTPIAEPLASLLRPYQRGGVHWLRFLEDNGFGGILADEMGLGKTVQTLAWLAMERRRPAVRGRPALIVCPTSLVENWQEEAARFVPDLKVVQLTGTDRRDRWDDLTGADIAVTSYAIMRRDIEFYASHEFAALVLDEAQHIKNHSTQNSRAAKRLRSDHRLVLTGTPMENSVSDLWSIMDFLMPGYLGGYELFRHHTEAPIARGGQDAAEAHARLRRKLQPFLLRRLKKEVARDLPPKILKIAHCTLTPDQRQVYQQVLEASRRRLSSLVQQQGFQRSRMEVLKVLLQLRQACCHLDLLKLPGLESEQPSGKMDLFFELLDEAIDGGHRVLVFSQFVSMLTILRRELEQRELRYCYLDGSTKERQKEVRTFNTSRDIPLFLISLKAGGTGLNLTGADTVIHYDPWWNPAVEEQATDRAYRIGQRRTVYSLKLITRDTVEEKVLALQQRKQASIDAVLGQPDEFGNKLTWDEVRELLEM